MLLMRAGDEGRVHCSVSYCSQETCSVQPAGDIRVAAWYMRYICNLCVFPSILYHSPPIL
jgi:hypothetical protein